MASADHNGRSEDLAPDKSCSHPLGRFKERMRIEIQSDQKKTEGLLPVSSGLIHRIYLLSQPTGKKFETKERKRKLENSTSRSASYGMCTKGTGTKRRSLPTF